VLITAAFKEYGKDMVKAMTAFSRDEEAARDGVAQAFTGALVNAGVLENMPEPAMKAWLYASARNAVIDIKRREKRFAELTDYVSLDKHEAGPIDSAVAAILLEQLPPALREPVRRKYFEGMNSTEIGKAMALPPATVRTRLRKAIGLMRQFLEQGEPNEH
jgi:RNA polymerase sigma-70 factor (ECF subfamily)